MDFVHHGLAAYEAGQFDEAARAFDAALAGDPADGRAAFGLGLVNFNAGRMGQALAFFERSARFETDDPAPFNELGRIYQKFGDYEKAEKLFRHALSIDPENVPSMANLGMALLNLGDIDAADEWTRKAIDIGMLDMNVGDARRNLGLILLRRQNWAEAWPLYCEGLGHGSRAERKYPGTNPWYQGAGGKVAVYGEQGIGDQLLFASCIPDLIADGDEVVIEVERRLCPLFARSFPDAKVFGTLKDEPYWLPIENPEYRVAMGDLPATYRTSQESFPGTPYLKANPAMRAMVRGLLDSLPRPKKVGIAWTGGLPETGRDQRSLDIREVMQWFDGIDASFVSLEYTQDPEVDPRQVGVNVFDFLTDRSLDYDYTAALVSELDAVISVPTAVLHLAGALGTPTLVMLDKTPAWRCGGPTMPWYQSVDVLKGWTGESLSARLREVLDNGAV
jgi:Tfp pilus assembly protein PilF